MRGDYDASGQDAERDRAVVQDDGADHEEMEDLVVAEHERPRVGSARRVHDRARGVEHAAGRDERDAGDAGLAPQVAQRQQADPAEHEVDGGDVAARRADRQPLEHHAAEGDAPHDTEHDRRASRRCS